MPEHQALTALNVKAGSHVRQPVEAMRRFYRGRIIGVFGLEHAAGVLDLRAIIAADCRRMLNPSTSIYERCGVHFRELPRWF